MKSTRTAARLRRHRRVRKKIRGSAQRPRLAVFRSNRYIYAQVIDDDQGHTMAAASSLEPDLRNRPLTVETAGVVGKLLAERSLSAGVDTVVFDRGGYRFGGRVRALAEAARADGLSF
ncbi:MAG: 50S ribosomal protein L18 [Acidimicrobiia bacterium]|nr:50S ribosomal protein L18 [bacterium]MXX00774.1 50S ribosomal protein L18 [Acidimicrobiia bacterium]MXY75314.1 50S ribosomal protein L18 [Acidimicrobiia bacterium]MYA39869.1 50S ribosomal protein L18 [Acidimicrobiia bacterium]MYB79750.1 50S ribosomal protein L18 [Acidimicrobiia bacterium]